MRKFIEALNTTHASGSPVQIGDLVQSTRAIFDGHDRVNTMLVVGFCKEVPHQYHPYKWMVYPRSEATDAIVLFENAGGYFRATDSFYHVPLNALQTIGQARQFTEMVAAD
jgi:hypothetical protein